MFDLGQQMGLLLISWVFWFIVLYFFAWLFKRKIGKTLGTLERVFLVGEVSLLCAAANIAIDIAVKLYRTQ